MTLTRAGVKRELQLFLLTFFEQGEGAASHGRAVSNGGEQRRLAKGCGSVEVTCSLL
jgi:hypothetical protein